MKMKKIATFLQLLLCTTFILNAPVFGQAPSITYSGVSGTQNYLLNTAISTITPTNSGGTTAAYYPTPTNVITGLHTPTDVAVSYYTSIIVGNSASPGGIIIHPTNGNIDTTLGSDLVTSLSVNKNLSSSSYNFIYYTKSADKNVYYYNNGSSRSSAKYNTVNDEFTTPIGIAVDYNTNNALDYVYVLDAGVGGVVFLLNPADRHTQVPVCGSSNTPLSGIVRINNSGGLIWLLDNSKNLYYISGTVASGAYTGCPKVTLLQTSPVTLGSAYFSFDNSLSNAYLTFNGGAGYALSKLDHFGTGTTLNVAGGVVYAGVGVDVNSNLYVANQTTNTLQKFTLTNPYTISPALPTGLSINSTSGAISGTPTVNSAATTYTITAGNQYSSGYPSYFATSTTTVTLLTTDYSWVGTTASTSTSSNWASSAPPTSSSTIIIPSSATNQPVLGADLTVAGITFTGSGATLDLNGHTLTITGAVTGSGSFKGSTSSNLIVAGTVGTINFSAGSNSLANLTINSGSVTLGNALNLYGKLTPTGGTLTTGGNLTLKSVSSGTAVVGVVGGTISGTVNIERYIPQGYVAYRDLGVSVASTGTIASTLGSSLNNYTVYTYSAGSGWTTVTNSSNLVKNVGYRVFVNGYQNSAPSSGTSNSMNSAVTLAYSGTLNTGNQTISCTGGTKVFSLISNPYASQVDFTSLSKTNLYNGYWYLNPTTLYSGFERYSYYGADLGVSNIYTGSVSQYLQPGQGFFVCSITSGSTSLGFTESAKNNGGSQTAIFGAAAPLNRIATGLFNNGQNVDGAVVVFNPSFSNAVATEDGLKINNHDENMSFTVAGNELCANGWNLPTENDILPIHLYQLHTNTNYSLRIDASQFVSNTVQAYLQDNVLNTKTLLAGESNISFASANDTASFANRYSIIFLPSTLPVNSINIAAVANNGQVAINWNVIGASNVISYTVEHSTDGITFKTLTSVNSSSKLNFGYNDASAIDGVNYYRIKATDKDGSVTYSKVVSVSLTSGNVLSVYPNPVIGSSLKLKTNNLSSGVYALRVVNSLGQTVFTHSLSHSVSTTTESVTLPNKLPAGNYTIVASKNNTNIQTQLIIK